MDILREIEIKFTKIQPALDECERLKALIPPRYQEFFQDLVDTDVKNRLAIASNNIRKTLEAKMEAEITELVRQENEALNPSEELGGNESSEEPSEGVIDENI